MAIHLPPLLKLAAMAVVAFLAPIQTAVLTVLGLVVLDMVLGVVAAYRRREPITSRRMRDSVAKLLVFEATLTVMFLVQQNLTGDWLPLVKLASTFIGAVELKSVLENLNDISGGDLLKGLIAKLVRPEDQQP